MEQGIQRGGRLSLDPILILTVIFGRGRVGYQLVVESEILPGNVNIVNHMGEIGMTEDPVLGQTGAGFREPSHKRPSVRLGGGACAPPAIGVKSQGTPLSRISRGRRLFPALDGKPPSLLRSSSSSRRLGTYGEGRGHPLCRLCYWNSNSWFFVALRVGARRSHDRSCGRRTSRGSDCREYSTTLKPACFPLCVRRWKSRREVIFAWATSICAGGSRLTI